MRESSGQITATQNDGRIQTKTGHISAEIVEYQDDQRGRLLPAKTRHDGFGNLTQQSASTLPINRIPGFYSTECYKTSRFPARTATAQGAK